MKFSEFATLVSKIKEMCEARDEYMDLVPTDLSISVIDNVYTNLTGCMFDTLFDHVFGPDFSDDVGYFLYEPYPHIIEVDSKKYEINNVEEYLAYAHENFNFDPE